MSLEYRQPLISGHRSDSDPEGISKPLGGYLKRSLDIVVSISAIIVLSPLFLMVALAVKLSDGGPVIYAHSRVGYGGRAFGCLKFRTMCVDADERLHGYLRANPAAAAEWENTQKLKHDPRVTVIGRALRKTSVDELPQLFNILRGDMSLVGPRPVVTDELQKYGSHTSKYFIMRPGLTGLWQVSGRNDTTYDERVQLDVVYSIHWSFWNDLKIIMKTLPALYYGQGSY
jgi:exopolysaccharide production protein ExoY